MNKLNAVYHGDHGLRTLKELGRSYLTITRDQSRVMTRVKAIYRSWAIPCSGKEVYGSRHRAEWWAKIAEPGVTNPHSPATDANAATVAARAPAQVAVRTFIVR